MKKIFKILSSIIVTIVLIFCAYILFMFATDYKPENAILITTTNNKIDEIIKNKPFSIATFNIGYGGMDKYQDFFMDGGHGSRSISREKTLENIKNIGEFLLKQNADIILFQEVDKKSTRSNNINQVEYFSSNFSKYSSSFAINYKIPWVFVPLYKPHGKVESGLLTLSKYSIASATRYQYPGREDYPRQLFDLDRCFLETRMPVDGGGELVLINSHLSAFDKGGKIRKQQLSFLKGYIEKEYDQGNYVIVGGDWNHNLPGTDPNVFKAEQSSPDWLQTLPKDFTPTGFKWAVDSSVPSNRTADVPYKKGINFLSIIDGYLVSPNVDIKLVKGHSLDFEYTDHNPITAEFILK